MPITDFEIESTLTEFGNNLIADIQTQMQEQGLGQSDLIKSLEYEINDNRITVTAAPYYKYAQTGRGPGKVPYDFKDILELWIVKNGIKPKIGTISEFANVIKWKTIKEGSYMFRNPQSQRDFTTQPIEENLDWLEGKIGVDIIQQLEI